VTSNATRAATLVRALQAGLERDRETIEALCTPDVTAWTPTLVTSSVTELVEELDRRDEAFSAPVLDAVPLDVSGDYACVEWSVTMTHTGPLVLPGGGVLEPTGLDVTVRGVTVAEFRDDRICSVRQYWDEFTVLEQVGVVGESD
jgi:ketosteroid isomerase-like protein